MKIGLFFGSFSPVHVGHIRVAIEAYEQFKLDEVHFVISPQNPFKKESDLLPFDDRCNMLYEAIKGFSILKVNEVESFLPVPSYTADTLKYLQSNYKDTQFYLIMGQDCLNQILQWKDYEYIIANFHIIVFPRNGYSSTEVMGIDIHNLPMPYLDISSTVIRNKIKKGESIACLVPDGVLTLIVTEKYYK